MNKILRVEPYFHILLTDLKYLLKLAENMKYMTGLAAELSGARLCMKVAMALTVSLLGMSS